MVDFGGVRIGGCSGIYKSGDYKRGHFEYRTFGPYLGAQGVRSAYHTRSSQARARGT